MELTEVLRRRKMTRSFARRPVPPAVMDRVLASVRAVPTAGHTQGNEFLVLEEPEATEAFWRITDDPEDPYAPEELAVAPPVLILPMAHKQAYLERYSAPDKAAYGLGDEANWPVPYWDIDAGMAAMVLMLAAIDEGLGAWFFGAFHGEVELLARFGVPAGFRPVGVVGVGYPAPSDPLTRDKASSRKLPRRPVDDLLHRDAW